MNCGHCQNNLLLPPSLFALPICQLLLLLLLHGKRKVTNMQIDLKKRRGQVTLIPNYK